MARNRTKKAYYTVGIPIESATYHALKADSQETGVSIAQLVMVRIADWYKQTTRIESISPMTSELPTIATEPLHNTVQRDAASDGEGLRSRAAAAAKAWQGEDDE